MSVPCGAVMTVRVVPSPLDGRTVSVRFTGSKTAASALPSPSKSFALLAARSSAATLVVEAALDASVSAVAPPVVAAIAVAVAVDVPDAGLNATTTADHDVRALNLAVAETCAADAWIRSSTNNSVAGDAGTAS